MKRINWAGLLAMLGTLGGVAASPLVGGLVSGKIAAVLIGVSSIAQAITKAVHDVKAPAQQ